MDLVDLALAVALRLSDVGVDILNHEGAKLLEPDFAEELVDGLRSSGFTLVASGVMVPLRLSWNFFAYDPTVSLDF